MSSNSNSDSSSSSSKQETTAPTSVNASTSVKVTESKDAKKPEDEGEKKAAQLMNELNEKMKQGHLENAVGISNLLNVLFNNVKKLNNFFLSRSSKNVREALSASQKAQAELESDPNNKRLQQKAMSANANLSRVVEKEKNFLDVYTKESQGTLWERLPGIKEKLKVTVPKLAGEAGESFTVANYVGRKIVNEYKKSKESNAVTDTPDQPNSSKSNRNRT